MLGIILIIFIGRSYYQLAGDHNKSEWAFAILGIVAYYGTYMLASFIIGIVMELNWPGSTEDTPTFVLGLYGLPFGLLGCWLLYVSLKNSWAKSKDQPKNTSLDSDLMRYDKTER